MKTATIPEPMSNYRGAGFAAALVDESTQTVVRMVYTEGHFDDAEVRRFTRALNLTDAEEENDDLRVAVGMASCTRFHYLFTDAERKAIRRNAAI